jgi:FixJ family two-component response regulator
MRSAGSGSGQRQPDSGAIVRVEEISFSLNAEDSAVFLPIGNSDPSLERFFHCDSSLPFSRAADARVLSPAKNMAIAGNQPTVFVVDDDRPLRLSVAELLRTLHYRVRAFATARGFLSCYRAEMPGCLLLDVRMPQMDGLSLYEQLLAEGKRLPVIFMTARADVSVAVAAMKAGAIEFLQKPFDRGTLVERIQQAMQLDADWRARESAFHSLDSRIARLTVRDRQTLELILAGESNKSMAERLDLTERAVEMRRAALMRRLNVGSLVELLELAVTHRIHSELRQSTGFAMRGALPAAQIGRHRKPLDRSTARTLGA